MTYTLVFSFGDVFELEVTPEVAARVDTFCTQQQEIPNANKRRSMFIEFTDLSGTHYKFLSRGYCGYFVAPPEET